MQDKTIKIRRFIRKQGMCQANDIMHKFSLSKSSVMKYLKDVGVLTSFNSQGQYYILQEQHLFNEDDLLFIGDVGFYKGGNLLAAICHLVKRSSHGLGSRELDTILKTTTHSQLPNLFKTGQLQRESAVNRAGNAYIYFSPDSKRAQEQRDAYSNPPYEHQEHQDVELAPRELPDAIDVLLTLLANPDFSAKSVALSLQRRGLKITKSFTMRVFQAYGLSKKNLEFATHSISG